MKKIDQHIKEALSQWEGAPSSHCWEMIDSQLPIPNPAPTSQPAGTESAGAIGSKVSSSLSFTSSVAAKVTILVASIGVVVTAVTLLLIRQPATTTPVNETPIALLHSDSTSLEEDVSMIDVHADSSTLSTQQVEKSTKTTNKGEIMQNNIQTDSKQQPTADNSYLSTLTPTTIPPSSTLTEEKINRPDIPIAQEDGDINENSSSSLQSSSENLFVTPNNKDEEPIFQTTAPADLIFASAPIVLEIPNVITPNGDGINDVFVIKGIENCTEVFLSIKNKGGKEVFSTSNYQNNWGEGVEAGAYYYYFQYTMFNVKDAQTGVLHVIK